jgi:hypothetical protein
MPGGGGHDIRHRNHRLGNIARVFRWSRAVNVTPTSRMDFANARTWRDWQRSRCGYGPKPESLRSKWARGWAPSRGSLEGETRATAHPHVVGGGGQEATDPNPANEEQAVDCSSTASPDVREGVLVALASFPIPPPPRQSPARAAFYASAFSPASQLTSAKLSMHRSTMDAFALAARRRLLKRGVRSEDDRLVHIRWALTEANPRGLYGDVRDEYVRRLAAQEASEAREVDETSTLLERAKVSLPREAYTDPLRPTPFVVAAAEVAEARRAVDKIWARRTGLDPAAMVKLTAELEVALARVQTELDAAFLAYVTAALDGLRRPHTVSAATYTKAAADAALRGAIGCPGTTGNGLFDMALGPSGASVQLDMSDDHQAGVAFGLYMARKGFCLADPRKQDAATAETLEQLLGDDPNPDPDVRAAQHRVCRAIVRTVFADLREDHERARVPNSGKSCNEAPRKFSGKRGALFNAPDPRTERAVSCGCCGFPVVDDPDLEGFPVCPLTILSAGKNRTISLASVRNERHAWLNRAMFSRVRRAAWMIGGRTVADWVAQVQPRAVWRSGRLPPLWRWVSGDARAATQLASGSYASVILDEIVDMGVYTHAMFGQSDAQLKRELREQISEAVLGVAGIGHIHALGRQKRGQLMASDFSFPLLCILGFLVGITMHGDLAEFDALAAAAAADEWTLTGEKSPVTPSDRFVRAFYGYAKIGVNGDDFVTWCPPVPLRVPAVRACDGRPSSTRLESYAPPEAWIWAIRTTSMEPEPPKSPCDATMFTVNSQLWRADGEVRQVDTVLPAMFLGLHGAGYKPLDIAWLSALRSPLGCPGSPLWRALQIDVALLPDVPRTAGGSGLVAPRSCGDMGLAARRIAWALVARDGDIATAACFAPSAEARFFSTPAGRRAVKNRWGDTVTEFVGGERDLLRWDVAAVRAVAPPVPGWYDRAALTSVVAKRHALRRGVYWTSGTPGYRTRRELVDAAHQLYATDASRLNAQAKVAWRYEQRGYVFATYVQCGSEERLPCLKSAGSARSRVDALLSPDAARKVARALRLRPQDIAGRVVELDAGPRPHTPQFRPEAEACAAAEVKWSPFRRPDAVAAMCELGPATPAPRGALMMATMALNSRALEHEAESWADRAAQVGFRPARPVYDGMGEAHPRASLAKPFCVACGGPNLDCDCPGARLRASFEAIEADEEDARRAAYERGKE